MLIAAKHVVCESAADTHSLVREIRKEGVVLPDVGPYRFAEMRGREPRSAAGFEHSLTFCQQRQRLGFEEVFQNVGAVDAVDRFVGKRKPKADIKPHVLSAERIRVNIKEAGASDVSRPAAKMQT